MLLCLFFSEMNSEHECSVSTGQPASLEALYDLSFRPFLLQ